jgi:hypothetical protein
MSYKFEKTIDGSKFMAPSKIENKKYDVIAPNGKKFSFGDKRYQQYHDKIGYYKNLDHNDKQRRDNYRARHKHDKLDSYSSGFFSYNFLW